MTKFAATLVASLCLLGVTGVPATTAPPMTQTGWMCSILRIKC